MSNLPNRISSKIQDPHLQDLVQQVWSRLKSFDQAVLRTLVFEFAVAGDIKDYAFRANGYAAPPSVYSNKGPGEDIGCHVTIPNAGNQDQDNACMYVIAHEFAHVVLRHNQLSAMMNSFKEFDIYSDEDFEEYNTYAEETASLLVWAWGFEDEFNAFFCEVPEAYRPRWFSPAAF